MIRIRMNFTRLQCYLFHNKIFHRMPKHKSTNKEKANGTARGQEVAAPVSLSQSGDIRIQVWAKPGAKVNTITEISPEGVGVKIAAPPREGEANAELCRYLAEVLSVRKTAVSLDKGSKSRTKTILVQQETGMTSTAVMEALQKQVDDGS